MSQVGKNLPLFAKPSRRFRLNTAEYFDGYSCAVSLIDAISQVGSSCAAMAQNSNKPVRPYRRSD
jgi:hypothetical protein